MFTKKARIANHNQKRAIKDNEELQVCFQESQKEPIQQLQKLTTPYTCETYNLKNTGKKLNKWKKKIRGCILRD